ADVLHHGGAGAGGGARHSRRRRLDVPDSPALCRRGIHRGALPDTGGRMGEDDVTNAVLAERIRALNTRVDDKLTATNERLSKIEKAISFVQWGVVGAVLTSLMKLLGLG